MGENQKNFNNEFKKFWKDGKNIAIVILSFFVCFFLFLCVCISSIKVSKALVNSSTLETSALNSEITTLDSEKKELDNKITEYTNKISELENTNKTLSEENEKLKAEKQQLETEKNDLTSKLNSLQQTSTTTTTSTTSSSSCKPCFNTSIVRLPRSSFIFVIASKSEPNWVKASSSR